MKKRRSRIISSVSGVITNSSTQVFEIGITDELLERLKSEGIESDVTVIRSRKDLFDLFPDTSGMTQDEVWSVESKQTNILTIIYKITGGNYDLAEEGWKGYLWKLLNDSGKTDAEILEFFDCIIDIDHNLVGKIIYTYSDDCGYSKAAEVLYDLGAESDRLS